MAIENLTDEYGNLLPAELGDPGDVLTVNSTGDASAWAAPSGGGSPLVFSLSTASSLLRREINQPSFATEDFSVNLGPFNTFTDKWILIVGNHQPDPNVIFSKLFHPLEHGSLGERQGLIWPIDEARDSAFYRYQNNLRFASEADFHFKFYVSQ